MTERLPFRPLCLRTVASKGVCTPAKLQPTAAGARCKGEATGPAPAGASNRPCEKALRAGKASNLCPSRASVRYWQAAWSGVRAAEGARLEIAWAGSTRLEGSNPSHSASIPGRPGRIAQRESARFTRGRSLVQSQVRPSPGTAYPSRFRAALSTRRGCSFSARGTRGVHQFLPQRGEQSHGAPPTRLRRVHDDRAVEDVSPLQAAGLDRSQASVCEQRDERDVATTEHEIVSPALARRAVTLRRSVSIVSGRTDEPRRSWRSPARTPVVRLTSR
jgi:hypothetical protein